MKWNFLKKKEKKPVSLVRGWIDAVTFAVVVATLFRWSAVEAFMIPTASMENSLMTGDYLFVSKFHYGTRTPRTILQIPLTHQKIWGTEIPSYLPWIELPYYRLPGISEVKRGDAVVFNVPPAALSEGKDYPVDLKTYYVKRCVGLPGDRLSIKDQEIIVNGVALPHPEKMKYSYIVIAKEEINTRNLTRLKIAKDDSQYIGRTQDNKAIYQMYLTQAQLENMKAASYVISIENDERHNQPEDNIFPQSMAGKWSGDNYGPLVVPAKGMTIPVNDSTLAIYGFFIQKYDHNKSVSINNGKLIVNGKELKEYTFNQDYFFMMGDNRHNSLDSRYWGFVPEDHIAGKPLFVFFSVDKDADMFHKVRWNRLLHAAN